MNRTLLIIGIIIGLLMVVVTIVGFDVAEHTKHFYSTYYNIIHVDYGYYLIGTAWVEKNCEEKYSIFTRMNNRNSESGIIISHCLGLSFGFFRDETLLNWWSLTK